MEDSGDPEYIVGMLGHRRPWGHGGTLETQGIILGCWDHCEDTATPGVTRTHHCLSPQPVTASHWVLRARSASRPAGSAGASQASVGSAVTAASAASRRCSRAAHPATPASGSGTGPWASCGMGCGASGSRHRRCGMGGPCPLSAPAACGRCRSHWGVWSSCWVRGAALGAPSSTHCQGGWMAPGKCVQ